MYPSWLAYTPEVSFGRRTKAETGHLELAALPSGCQQPRIGRACYRSSSLYVGENKTALSGCVYGQKNAYRKFQHGKQDAVFPITPVGASGLDGKISNPIIIQHWMLYSFQDTGKAFFSTSDYKENFSIGATFGTDEWFWLKKNGYRVTKQPKGSDRLIELLLDRKVEAILLPKVLMNQEFERRNLSANSFSTIELHSQSLGIYFSDQFLGGRPNFINRFNQALSVCIPPSEEES